MHPSSTFTPPPNRDGRRGRSSWCRLVWAIAGVVCGLTPTSRAGVDNPEVEPNDLKTSAFLAASGGGGMRAGDTISGTTTGSASDGTTTSADTFIVKTGSSAGGIYRHQLVLTSATPGHVLTVRGLTQSAGVLTPGSDATVQTGLVSAPGQPANSRMVQWYGFGRQEIVYVRVTGTASTTSPYSIELKSDPVGVTALGSSLASGSVTISRAATNANDVDFWMYDASLRPISNYGNDQPNSLTRTYTPGTYYIAIGDSNFANGASAPADDTRRNGNVLDSADAAINATTSSGLDMGVKALSALGSIGGGGTKTNPFDVTWYCFTVVPNTIATAPVGVAEASVAMASNCGTDQVCMQVAVSPGQNPTSTTLSVTMNFTAIQGPANVQLFDDGLNCDGLANDRVFGVRFTVPAGIPTGTFSFPFTVRDERGRSSTGQSAPFTVVSCTPPVPVNDPCTSATLVTPGPSRITGTTVRATADAVPNCSGAGSQSSPGVWYRVIGTGTRMTARTCATRTAFDSVIQVYCAANGCGSLSCVAAGNDDCGLSASATWCSEAGAPYLILVRGLTAASTGFFDLEVLDSGMTCNDSIECLPRGACCIPNGCIRLTRDQCLSAGGTYQGDGVPCVQTTQTIVHRASVPTPVAIPDGNTLGAFVTLAVPPGQGPVPGLGLMVGLRHGRIGDLLVTVTKGNRTVTLFEKVGSVAGSPGDTSDLDGLYIFKDDGANLWAAAAAAGVQERVTPGIYAPARVNDGGLPLPSVAAFDTEPASGTWVLRVRDLSQGESGVIDSFGLVSFTQEPTCGSPCPSCAADFNDDGGVDGGDTVAFYDSWEAGEGCADVNEDGGVDGEDVVWFFRLWEAGGC